MSGTPNQPTQRLQFWCLLFLVAITGGVFSSVCGHEFVHYDDAGNIYANPHLEGGLGPKQIAWMLTDTSYARRYMPLGWFCYAANIQLFGLNSSAFHAVNLALHAGNVVLLFFLLKYLLAVSLKPTQGAAAGMDRTVVWCSAVGALFWAVHPLRAENLGWASAEIYSVLFLFMGISLLAWLRSQESERSSGSRKFLRWLAVAAYAASLLTYPLALFGPVLFFALEVFPLRRMTLRLSDWFKPPARAVLLDKIPFVLMSAAVLGITLFARAAFDNRYRPTTLEEWGLLPRVMQSLYIWAYYVWKPLAPFNLAPSYSTLHAFDPFDARFVLSGIFVAGVTMVLFFYRRRWPAAFVVWVCHLVLLVPVLGLTEYPHCAYDRYSYLQGILLSCVLVFGLHALWGRGLTGQWSTAAVGALSLVFAAFSWHQVQVWQNTITVYQRIVEHAPEHPSRARFDEVLGVQYLNAGRTNDAIQAFNRVVYYEARRADRHLLDEGVWPRVHTRLAELFVARGEKEKAAHHYVASVQESGASAIQFLRAASALIKLGDDAAAIACLQQSLHSNPTNAFILQQLGVLLKKQGRNEEAERHLRESAALQ